MLRQQNKPGTAVPFSRLRNCTTTSLNLIQVERRLQTRCEHEHMQKGLAMTNGQTSELVDACHRLLSVSPEVAQSIIDDLYEDAEIAHFHLATLVNVLTSAEQGLPGDREVVVTPANSVCSVN